MSRAQALIEGAAAFGLALSDEAAGLLLAYLDGVLAANEHINLTAVRDPEEAVSRHILDSLAFGLHAREAGAPKRVIDVGSGAGFPGVPIAIAWPACEAHLVDSTRKKVNAVRDIVTALGIKNVDVHWGRAESLQELGRADAVTARAVGSLSEVLAESAHLVAPRGALVVWKADALPDGERKEALTWMPRLGMESLPDLEYQLVHQRRLVRFRKR